MPACSGVGVGFGLGVSLTGSSLKASFSVVTGTALQFPVNASADRDFQAGARCVKRPRYRLFGPAIVHLSSKPPSKVVRARRPPLFFDRSHQPGFLGSMDDVGFVLAFDHLL